MIRWLIALIPFLAAAAEPPKLMLWAWERDTDLRFLDPAQAGVAYHFANLHLDHEGVSPFVRQQPLLLKPGTYRMPVVRIDTQFDQRIPYSAKQRAEAAQMIVEAVQIAKAQAIQIDFDAVESAYLFYRALLEDVRKRVGPRVFISITALISWCGSGSWMAGLPVDEIVPMMFRTGLDALRLQQQFGFAGCQNATGVSMDTKHPPLAGGRRIYVFPGYGKNWDAKMFSSIQNELR